jgi:ABC-type transport system involved in multi-copper enzyme maturation permease subunit
MKGFELFDLREKIESRINQYWTYWSGVVLAVGTWLFSSFQPKGEQLIVLMLALFVFFIANLYMIWNSTELSMGLKNEISLRSISDEYESSELKLVLAKNDFRFRLILSILLHVGIDLALFVVLLIRLTQNQT